MALTINLYISLLLAVFLLSCGGSNKEEKTVITDTSAHGAHDEVPVAFVPVLNDRQLNAVYQQYLVLSEALTVEDIAKAKITANAIEAGAQGIAGAGPVMSAAAKITTARNVEEQRKAFYTMTKAMEVLVKREGMARGEIYVAHCPMAFDDEGASWLTSVPSIRNPYFGYEMLTCGDIEETIK